MPRVKGGFHHHRRARELFSAVRGHKQARRTRYQTARESLLHAMAYQTAHRRLRKRDMRALWITRINAAVRPHGLSYSRFVRGLLLAGVGVDRKNLADLAIREPEAFGALVNTAQAALGK
ncbi:MAG: 50S ribosomal protein L20 [Chloroflexi bacterium]|nr:50S ribosomal protein L20 [Chloroflexota bacterium]